MGQLKKNILQLRTEGKTYNQIQQILSCSKGTIAYHLGQGVKENYRERARDNRAVFRDKIKIKHGGKCCICGYCKTLKSLHFHHKDSADKVAGVSNLIRDGGFAVATAEAEKCVLVCANCHGEIHAGITPSPV